MSQGTPYTSAPPAKSDTQVCGILYYYDNNAAESVYYCTRRGSEAFRNIPTKFVCACHYIGINAHTYVILYCMGQWVAWVLATAYILHEFRTIMFLGEII